MSPRTFAAHPPTRQEHKTRKKRPKKTRRKEDEV
jgi:hypothetical protein